MEKQHFDCGGRLRQLRTQHEISQEELALRADVTPSYVSQIERGIRNPTVLMIELLCEAMGCSVIDFFCGTPGEFAASDNAFFSQINQFFQDKSTSQKRKYLQMLRYLEEFEDIQQ